MSAKSLKFNRQDRPEFFRELRKRVNAYFKENEITKFGNAAMAFKSTFMICLYFIPLFIMIFGSISNVWIAMLLWVLMGFGMSGIGLSIMHDANHGAYSSNPRINKAMGFLVNFVGGYHINWRIQHNVLHHSYTNVHGLDEDIDNNLMRFTPDQEYNKVYRWQAFYAPFLYGLMTVYWFTGKDFAQLKRYREKELLETQGITYKRALTELLINKTWYVALTLVLPMIMVGIPWWQSLLGFFIMHFICGLGLALIFQPAHVIEETDFFEPSSEGSVENSWAIHQLRTTANFANKSTFFSWFIGGLNFQIEHHLFPNICHIHYKKLSKIVKATAEEYGIPYHQHKTFVGAVGSHFRLLNQLGTGEYDKMMAKAEA